MPIAPSLQRAAALALGAVLAAQCLLAPWVLHRGAGSMVFAVGSVAVAVALAWAVPRAHARAAADAVALVAVPTLLAMTSVLVRGSALGAVRYEPAARAVAALTAVGYFAAIASARQSSAPRVVLAIKPTAVTSSAAPPLRALAWGCLLLGAALLAVLTPAALGPRPASALERGLGPQFPHARDGLVSTAGLALALAWTLFAGPRLVRGKGSPYGRRARAVAMVVWSFAFGALWWWVDRAR